MTPRYKRRKAPFLYSSYYITTKFYITTRTRYDYVVNETIVVNETRSPSCPGGWGLTYTLTKDSRSTVIQDVRLKEYVPPENLFPTLYPLPQRLARSTWNEKIR